MAPTELTRSLALAFALLVGGASACAKLQERLANTFLGDKLVQSVNVALAPRLPRTVGDCTRAEECSPVYGFPIEESWSGVSLHADYITHVDTLRMRTLSLRCSPDAGPAVPSTSTTSTTFAPTFGALARAADAWGLARGVASMAMRSARSFVAPLSADEGSWYIQFEAGFDELALGTRMEADWPHFKVEAPCTEGKPCAVEMHNLTLKGAARVACLDHDTFGLQVDSDYGIHFGRPLAADFYAVQFDLTKRVEYSIADAMNHVTGPCPSGKLGDLCRLMCSGAAPQGAQRTASAGPPPPLLGGEPLLNGRPAPLPDLPAGLGAAEATLTNGVFGAAGVAVGKMQQEAARAQASMGAAERMENAAAKEAFRKTGVKVPAAEQAEQLAKSWASRFVL